MPQYFRSLNYTMGDEDATPEMQLLREESRHVMAVADCGSRIIPLLARRPRWLTCVDISPPQLAVCELRIALLKGCTREEFMGFLGYDGSMSASTRQALFQRLGLSGRSRDLLKAMFDEISWGPMLYLGQFERMLQKVSRVTRLLTGRAGAGIFDATTLDEQRHYVRTRFPHWRWRLVLLLLGNSTALNSLLYKGEFPRKNIDSSHFSIYQAIFDRLFNEQMAKASFFLQMVFLGHVPHGEGHPVECREDVYAQAQAALAECRIDYVEGDVFETAARQDQTIDFLSLSDVPSFLPASAEADFLQQVRPGLAKDALVVVRAHLRRPHPTLNEYIEVSHQHPAAALQDSTRLWSFHMYKTA